MKYLIIGDIHGHVEVLPKILEQFPDIPCIQIGDFGFSGAWSTLKKTYSPDELSVIPGNHDCHDICYDNPNCLGRFGNHKDDFFFVAGAYSIDKYYRTKNIDWWANEELDEMEQAECRLLYRQTKPNIILSHDAPDYFVKSLWGYSDKQSTRLLLESLRKFNQPKLWFSGHHHSKQDIQFENTRYICLDINEYCILDTETYEVDLCLR